MKDNTRTAIGYVCIALVFISYFVMVGWIGSPNEFTIKLEMDNNTKEAVESVEYPIIDTQPTEEYCESLINGIKNCTKDYSGRNC